MPSPVSPQDAAALLQYGALGLLALLFLLIPVCFWLYFRGSYKTRELEAKARQTERDWVDQLTAKNQTLVLQVESSCHAAMAAAREAEDKRSGRLAASFRQALQEQTLDLGDQLKSLAADVRVSCKADPRGQPLLRPYPRDNDPGVCQEQLP